MSTIGIVTFDSNDDTYKGSINTMAIKAPVELRPVKNKPNDRYPDYRAYSGSAQIGAAWIKQNEEGIDYVSCSFDDPAFPAPIYCRLGKAAGQDDEDVFALIWNRPGS